ncbi:hypothetical protein SAMN02745116_01392 [Pilibacter termitis]|uniref:Uncharacterized protein n=1 Tax=Pilibacter termitis TaxID=263852 RepID=A0A1T4NDU9_9ENTE|nr:hypothetical protein [Pilibacter termitis]SJZ77313.1 hypothetical protein SAMN02745116_01392 [Pilibacter termitis]
MRKVNESIRDDFQNHSFYLDLFIEMKEKLSFSYAMYNSYLDEMDRDLGEYSTGDWVADDYLHLVPKEDYQADSVIMKRFEDFYFELGYYYKEILEYEDSYEYYRAKVNFFAERIGFDRERENVQTFEINHCID